MKLLLLLPIALAPLAAAAPVASPRVLARSGTQPTPSPIPTGDIFLPHRHPFTAPPPPVSVVSRPSPMGSPISAVVPSVSAVSVVSRPLGSPISPAVTPLSKRGGLINVAGCQGWMYDGDNPVCSPVTGTKAMTPAMRLATLEREITDRIHPDYDEEPFSHPQFHDWKDNGKGDDAASAAAKEKRQDEATVGPFPYPEDDPQCRQDRTPTPFTCDMTHDEVARMNEKLAKTEGYDAKVAVMDAASSKVMDANNDLFAQMWKELTEEVYEGVRMCKEEGYTVEEAVAELETHKGKATLEWIAKANAAQQDPEVGWAEEHSGEAPPDYKDPGSGW